jgi:hypothetical protein
MDIETMDNKKKLSFISLLSSVLIGRTVLIWLALLSDFFKFSVLSQSGYTAAITFNINICLSDVVIRS